MIPALLFGPFEPGLSDAERVARCRVLRTCVLFVRRNAYELMIALYRAESDPDQLPVAFELFEALPALTKRHILSGYITIATPWWRTRIHEIEQWIQTAGDARERPASNRPRKTSKRKQKSEDDEVKVSKMFPSRYLKAEDVMERPLTVTIQRVVMEEVGPEKQERPILYFENQDRGMVCNKTNGLELAASLGDDTDSWVGHAIVLHAGKVPFGGKLVDALKVRVPRPHESSGPGQLEPKKKRGGGELSSDSIPF